MLVAALVILFLILLTGLYVAAEFAAVGARRSRLRRLAEDGNALAARILPVVEDAHELDRYIAVSQVGITLSSLILGAYGQATLAPAFGRVLQSVAGLEATTAQSAAAAIVLLTLTVLAMIIGELVPKSLALQYPTQTALATVLPMEWSQKVAKWAIDGLNGSGILLLKVMRVPVTGHRHVHSPEEIELLIAESRDGGLLEPQEQVRLHRALRLGLRTARQLMVPRARLVAVEASTPFDEVMDLVASSPYSRLPVYRGAIDQVVGILHTKDLVTSYVQSGDGRPARMVLRPLVEVPGSMPADKLLALLKEQRSHQAIVRDESGAVAGLITLEDVVAELLGGVTDEFKTTQIRPLRLSDGRIRVPGAMRLDQAAAMLGAKWSGAAETAGAYVMEVLGRLPEPSERVTIHGMPVEIEAVDNGVVASMIAGDRPAPAEETS
jgi:putative hemolysin